MPVLPPTDQNRLSIAISIVSHGHGAMVERLVAALLDCPEVGQVIVTRNIPESLALPENARVTSIDNSQPAGFAANHNAAFCHCNQPYFCPINPDIRLLNNPFPALITSMKKKDAALAAPLVRNPSGKLEDNIRFFPTLRSLLLKLLSISDGRYLSADGPSVFCPEWVAGMFMLFRSADFRRLGGFDPRFFLYYEDVDICVRAWKAGIKVVACPAISVEHDAQRASHRNLRHLRWHLVSMARYFIKHWGRLPRVRDRE